MNLVKWHSAAWVGERPTGPPHAHPPTHPLAAPTHPTQALAVNEFTGASWNYPYDASDPDSPLMGHVILQFRGFGTE